MTKTDNNINIEKLKFEAVLEKLEEIVDKLSDESIPIEDAIDLYESGVVYLKRCKDILADSEQRITIIEEDIEKDL